MNWLKPLLAHRPTDWNFLMTYVERIRKGIVRLSALGLDWGVLHGDPFSGNLRIGDEHQVTFFDFDSCGYGWRAWDLCDAFVIAKTRKRDETWREFVRGYSEYKVLEHSTIEAIPLFVAAASVWTMGHRVRKGERIGMEGVDDEYFDESLRWVHETEQYL